MYIAVIISLSVFFWLTTLFALKLSPEWIFFVSYVWRTMFMLISVIKSSLIQSNYSWCEFIKLNLNFTPLAGIGSVNALLACNKINGFILYVWSNAKTICSLWNSNGGGNDVCIEHTLYSSYEQTSARTSKRLRLYSTRKWWGSVKFMDALHTYTCTKTRVKIACVSIIICRFFLLCAVCVSEARAHTQRNS